MNQLAFFDEELPALKQIDRGFIVDMLRALLDEISLEDFVRLITNDVDECLNYFYLTQGKNTCKNLSLLFNPHRLTVSTMNRKSVFDSLKDDSYIDGLSRAMTYCHNDGSKQNLFVRAFEIGTNGVGYANEFPPYVARDLCIDFGVTQHSRVLDPCGGWGGRMIGVSTVCDEYVCYEPSTRTYNGLLKLGKWLQNMQKDFRFEVNHLPFEDSVLNDDYFDFALTSPPYYDTEDYSDEDTQSKNRYGTFDEWCQMFYIPMIQKTMDSLKRGGYFVLNIGDRQYPLSTVLMDNFSGRYKIERIKDMLSGNTGGLRSKDKQGEAFYAIKKQ